MPDLDLKKFISETLEKSMIKKQKSMIIAVDFDGTCVTHEYPKVGQDIGAVPVLKDLVEAGHKLILFTMRSDTKEGNYLTDAVNWFKKNGIELYGVNTNPTQNNWTSSPKAYAQLYIDDAALGAPVIKLPSQVRHYIDWDTVRKILNSKGWL